MNCFRNVYLKCLKKSMHKKGCDYMIAMLWAQKIIAGKKTFDEVPRLLKEQVKDVLINSGFAELATE